MDRTLVWKTIRNSTWLLGGVVLLGVTFFLWLGLQIHEQMSVEKPLEKPEVPIEPEKVRFSPTLGMMTDIVPELNLKKTITTEEHAPEFKGADFMKAKSNKWTLQLMSVSKETVIKNYLDKRPDREKFYYFRYVEKNKPDRFILTYGVFDTVSVALQSLKTIDFELPPSVKVFPERFYTYKPHVVDSNSNEDIVNLGSRSKIYKVRLRSVPVPREGPVVEASTVSNRSPINASSSSEVSSASQTRPTSSSNSPSNTSPSNATTTSPTNTSEAIVQDPFN